MSQPRGCIKGVLEPIQSATARQSRELLLPTVLITNFGASNGLRRETIRGLRRETIRGLRRGPPYVLRRQSAALRRKLMPEK
jgi:hypothetical protein